MAIVSNLSSLWSLATKSSMLTCYLLDSNNDQRIKGAYGLTETKRKYFAHLGFEVQESKENYRWADLATQALAVLLKFK